MTTLPSRRISAFTLIELLVVVAVIALMVGVFGMALRDGGDPSTSLQSAQGTIASLLSSARGQAALKGQTAALFVNYQSSNADRYLRYCVVATTSDNVTWTAVNEGYYLPKGIYVVPPSFPVSETGVTFTPTLLSNGFDLNPVTGQKLNSTTAEQWLVLAINPQGQRTTVSGAAPGTNVVLSVANIQPAATNPPMKFSNSANVRGFSISQYGVAAFINDAGGFN